MMIDKTLKRIVELKRLMAQIEEDIDNDSNTDDIMLELKREYRKLNDELTKIKESIDENRKM